VLRSFHNLSIRHKLTLLFMGVVSAVLLAASVANVVSEVHTTRATMAARYSTLANIVAAQSGAALSIADVDDSGVREIVSDLAADHSICFAALFDAAGEEVVRYPADAPYRLRPSPQQPLGAVFSSGGFLDVVQEVKVNDGAAIGSIYLRATTDQLRAQIRRTMLIAVVVYLLALAVALLLSIALQRFISSPILELAELTQRVSKEHNYSLSVERYGHDELGTLCDGFNTMLAEIRRRDNELERYNDELLRSNDELRQFAFVASHDLQEPLRSITSFCNMLKDECQNELTPDASDYIERIVSGAGRMKSLVVDLLSYSRVNRDEQKPFTVVRMHEVMGDVLENLQGSIEASAADISWRDLPTICGDRSQLVQLLQNLVGNAILYRRDEAPSIRVEATPRGDDWEFAVRDNGIGIAREHYDQIFEIFKRLHRRNEYPGTGIGLAVCKKIVQRHGGQIWVESQLDEGSVFRFTIHTAPTNKDSHEREGLLAASI
jgi:signal transduction histidine kinase